jgi:hypothetical protein
LRRCEDLRRNHFTFTHETFIRYRRSAAMTQPDIWYVAYGRDRAVKTDDSATATVRSTRTFKSEVDAKLFAMQVLAKGCSANAGTLNPHQPKQTIAASQIERWADPGLGG